MYFWIDPSGYKTYLIRKRRQKIVGPPFSDSLYFMINPGRQIADDPQQQLSNFIEDFSGGGKQFELITLANAQPTEFDNLVYAIQFSLSDFDPTFQSALSSIGITTEQQFYDATNLILNSKGITDATGVRFAENCTYLSMKSNQLQTLTDVQYMTQLQILYLFGNQLTDVGKLDNLVNLQWLDLGFNQLTDIGSVTNMTSLISLKLGYNSLSNIGSLTGLTNLQYLQLFNNQLTSIDVTNCTKLKDLKVYQNPSLTSIGRVDNLTNLRYLEASFTSLTDIGSLANLTNLNTVYLNDAQFGSAELNRYVAELWANRASFSRVTIQLYNNPGTLTQDSIDMIEGTGAYAGDGIKTYGHNVYY